MKIITILGLWIVLSMAFAVLWSRRRREPDNMEVLGWIFEGEYYCNVCTPCNGPDYRDGGDGAEPIFYPEMAERRRCAVCGEPLDRGEL